MTSKFKRFNEIKGFLDIEEGRFLHELVIQHCANETILEIGSYCGKSACFLADAAEQVKATFISVDHHRGSEEHQLGQEYHDPEEYDERLNRINTYPSFKKNLDSVSLLHAVIPLISDSISASKIIKNDIGFVFIDGSHTFESAENDFYAWHEKIKKGGILAIHDIYDSEEEGGQAPRTIMLKALETNFKLLRRVKSLVALVKTK